MNDTEHNDPRSARQMIEDFLDEIEPDKARNYDFVITYFITRSFDKITEMVLSEGKPLAVEVSADEAYHTMRALKLAVEVMSDRAHAERLAEMRGVLALLGIDIEAMQQRDDDNPLQRYGL